MAPRRGGGGGYSGSSSTYSRPSVWTEKTQLIGTNFRNHYVVAQVVIVALSLFSLISIAIWSLTFRKRSEPSRALFKPYRFGIAIFLTLM